MKGTMAMAPSLGSTRRLRHLGTVLGLSLALAGCGGMPTNRTLDNVHQPVVEHTSATFDMPVQADGTPDPVQQHRLLQWFTAMGLKYGDHVAVDDPAQSGATHAAVSSAAEQFGLVLDPIAPVTDGTVPAGTVRVVVSRTSASVPGCPDWHTRSDANFNNATSTNYGCAVSSNLAAMVANKEDLVHGQSGGSDTVAATNTKAIDAYRAKPASGAQTLKQQSSQQLQ
jgi:pilus assembly protein CpaD